MALLLNSGTRPNELEVKTHGVGSLRGTVFIGDYEVSLDDWLKATLYVLTNTDLVPGDPRLEFVGRVGSMRQREGYNGIGSRRLTTPSDSGPA